MEIYFLISVPSCRTFHETFHCLKRICIEIKFAFSISIWHAQLLALRFCILQFDESICASNWYVFRVNYMRLARVSVFACDWCWNWESTRDFCCCCRLSEMTEWVTDSRTWKQKQTHAGNQLRLNLIFATQFHLRHQQHDNNARTKGTKLFPSTLFPYKEERKSFHLQKYIHKPSKRKPNEDSNCWS